MATEAASSVNGVYDGQYNQPAELAASTPSHGTSQSQSSSSTQQKADPQEIGWYFVEQYYTTLSKTPDRIHLFYSKKSQLVTGVEAEKIVPAVGTKAISEKIKSLDIQDCKVRVLNVDSQSSFDNIVVQVIGELSNKSQPHHKFVQTFVLATQPNGYFVLNDIFRYLSDEEEEVVEEQPAEEPVQVAEEAAPVEEPAEVKATEDVVDNEAAAEIVDEKLQEAPEEPTVVEEQTQVDDEVESEQADTTLEEPAEPATPDPVAIPQAEEPVDPEPTPAAESPKPISEVPTAKKTWASLVGNKAPAIPALPTTTTPNPASQSKSTRSTQPQPASTTAAAAAAAAASAPAPKAVTEPPTAITPPTTSTQSPVPATSTTQNNGWQTAEHSKKTKTLQAKASDGIVHAYIKNVTEKVDARILRETLEKYGELKYFDVSRPRNCAFVEFADPVGYAAAVAANPHDVGGEPIAVEERRPRPGQFNTNNTNTNFNRGGSNTGRGRGGLQTRSGSQGGFQKEGRGGFAQRGGKPGNMTPKGRGQAQAS